jgi:multiple sugar transport system ATP-binding protein
MFRGGFPMTARAPIQPLSSAASDSPALAEAFVRLRNLSKTYMDERGRPVFHAVKGINLEIQDGELLVLVGPSGCGKSTTLRMIAGLEKISGGTIEIGGQIVNQVEPKDRGIAMVFQNYALYPHMTVFDNLAFGLKLAKKEKPFIRQAVLRAATTLGLEALLDRKPQALSGGQRQRVALGRALVRNPKVFLFDEPLSNLDAQMRVQMRAEIARLHASLKTTMIYVTHDQVEAMTMGDRICVMREGVVLQVADPLTLYRQPQNLFVAGFIGSPPMSLLPGRIESRDSGLVFVGDSGSGALTLALSGRLERLARGRVGGKIVFGVRPEHLRVTGENSSPGAVGCVVEIAEPMGAETILYLKAGGSSLVGRAPGEQLYKKGEKLAIHINIDKAHLFDAESENVLAET